MLQDRGHVIGTGSEASVALVAKLRGGVAHEGVGDEGEARAAEWAALCDTR